MSAKKDNILTKAFKEHFMDIHAELILIKNSETQEFEDKTSAITHLQCEKNKIVIKSAGVKPRRCCF